MSRKLVVAVCATAALLITGCAASHPSGPSPACRALFHRESMALGRMGDLVVQQPKGWQWKFAAAKAAESRAMARMRAQACPMELKAYA